MSAVSKLKWSLSFDDKIEVHSASRATKVEFNTSKSEELESLMALDLLAVLSSITHCRLGLYDANPIAVLVIALQESLELHPEDEATKELSESIVKYLQYIETK